MLRFLGIPTANMAIPSPTAIFVALILLYISSFVFFAIVRIATGISIQRIGYFSLRRIAYSPREGLHLSIRGLGFSLHRPSFAQPTYISLRFQELKVTVDPKALRVARGETRRDREGFSTPQSDEGKEDFFEECHTPVTPLPKLKSTTAGSTGQRWKVLLRLKDRLKKLHRQIQWFSLVDISASNTTLQVVDTCELHIGTARLAVDTRRKAMENGKLFRHKKDPCGDQRPAEWMLNARNVLLALDGCEPREIVDNFDLNIHGLLHTDFDGLKDVSIALKVGRLHFPYDDVQDLLQKIKGPSSPAIDVEADSTYDERTSIDDSSLENILEESELVPPQDDETIGQEHTETKEFFASLVHGIQEIQVALSFFRLSSSVDQSPRTKKPLYLNVVTHEVGVDFHRMDPTHPAHRMYFQREEIAHQALLAAISTSVSLDENIDEHDKLLYIPMATATIKTTLPSKTVSIVERRDADECNTNVVFANFVITSPSLDIESRHLSQILALTQARQSRSRDRTERKRLLISQLLPKASIKLSVHEPVIRFVLPLSDAKQDYNLLVSSISSISLDVESSHSAEEGARYSVGSTYRVASHLLYYQTAAGVRHRLLATESMEVKAYLKATPEWTVAISGVLNEFSVHIVSAEVTRGVHQVVEQIRDRIHAPPASPGPQDSQSFLRRLPTWLFQFQFETSGFSIEVAGTDETVGSATRGMVLQLGGWSADYQLQKVRPNARSMRRRTPSHSAASDDPSFRFAPTSPPGKSYTGPSDGRRLALHVRGLEGFVIESADFMEPESFLSIPRFEVAFSTSSDLQGPIFHINSILHEIFLKLSLYRYYAVGIAAFTLKDAFYLPPRTKTSSQAWSSSSRASLTVPKISSSKPELTTFDMKIPSIHAECAMPRDPTMLIQVYGLVAGRHRWSAPFLRSHLMRLHVEPPKLKGFWARIVSVTSIRAGLRESRSKPAETLASSTSFDISTEFIRLAVPHHMIMHAVFDNFVNTVKSIEQLNHRLRTRSSTYSFEKPPSGPKHVPKICLRSKSVLFELEDDSFEWKLGCIYRLGLREQKQRLAREEAFFAKKKKIEECERRNANIRLRNRSAQAQRSTGRLRKHDGKRRSASADTRSRARSRSRNNKDTLKPRYDPCEAPEFTDSCKVNPEDAWYKLQANNARSWKSIIDESVRYQNKAIRNIRSIFAGADVPPEGLDDDDRILPMPNRPGLLSARISDFNLTIDAPSFPIYEYPLYLNRIGKGMPLDMKYSLLIPMSIRLEMGEVRANLRDYPLDLLHIPALGLGQSARLPSCSMKTEFVIAEEFRTFKSSRLVLVSIVPAGQSADGAENEGFSIQVRRTVSPVKIYSNPTVEINSNLPTSISWGMSYQPVIQDMMKIFENFTKPEIDPSERVGFWDKIRLSFHSRINVLWKGDGNVHLQLKGSRDPYMVTGFGAGFVMCWRKDVQLEIHTKDDPKELMTVTSGEYVLAVPDYSHQARNSYDSPFDNETSSSRSDRDLALFKKVIMKLSGNVRWLAGLVFERNADGRDRCFDFKPHYDVVLQNPKFLDTEKLGGYDAFRGFRSNHIHLSVAVVAPVSRDWSFSNRERSTSYNTVHLTPRFFTHFFSWWSLFSGVMSLPIRQGALWPGLTKTSKKFGRHLGTVKYNLFLSPLFVAHIYKHKDAEEYSEDSVFATGLKARLDSFMLDLHQRREQVRTVVKGRSKQTKTSMMRINRAQLDFIAADVRAVSSSIGGTNVTDIESKTDDIISSFQQPPPPPDFSRFTIPDDDLNWIDMDDFVEMDWILPAESNPKTLILPLAYSPRFSYFRQTDHQELNPEEPGYSLFGEEPTHFCVMSQDNDPRRVQIDMIKERLELLEAQISSHERLCGEDELKAARDGPVDDETQSEHKSFRTQGDSLRERQSFLCGELRRLEIQLFGKSTMVGCDTQTGQSDAQSSTNSESNNDGEATEDQYGSDFDNRFIIHNIQLKWNNSLRNIILRYIHQVGQRRGFVYYMSRRAVKFILDIVEEQGKSKTKRPSPHAGPHSESEPERDGGDEISVEDRIEQLLSDAKRCVNADDGAVGEEKDSPQLAGGSAKIAPEFTPQNSYHLRLIAPQIQLQSEKNKKSVALVTAKGMQLKVISIMDKHRVSDDVSGLVQRRFNLDMDSAQFFVATQKSFSSHTHIYCGNRYGNTPGSAWPPWVSLESMFDFEVDLSGFSRIIHKTSASLRYDKFNTLRLKYNEAVRKGEDGHRSCPVSNENRIDQISVEFPQVRAICDSTEYYSMYIIVLDLLLYSEPLEQIRNERLEKIMLASDFSDLRGAPEMVNRLQQRIRQLQEIKSLFLIQAAYLDKQGWEDRVALEQDLATCEDELFFIMKAITTSQRRTEDLSKTYSSGLLRWTLAASEIVFHLMTEHRQPLAEFQLRDATYERTDHIDGSNHNTIEVQNLHGLNLLSNAIYPQVITPYLDNQRRSPSAKEAKILKVEWHMLEAIAGIPVLADFEVTLFPLKIQLERDLGKKLFEYVFPGVGGNAFENGGFSPFMIKQIDPTDDDDEEDDEATSGTPTSATSAKSNSGEDSVSQSHLRAIERRLTPTMSLPEKNRSKSPVRSGAPLLALSQTNRDFVRYKRTTGNDRGRSSSRPATSRLPVKKASVDSLRLIRKQTSDRSLTSQNGNATDDKNKKFALPRQPTRSMTKDETDELSQMITRSSNYMILTHVKINDVVLCLSYKGRGERNIEDIHDFVFRLPVLEYRNKTWSNLDLALRLKKDAIKALISHTPAILGNKFSHHRPNKQQQKRLRELATSTQVLSVPDHQYNSGVSPSDGSNSIISRSSTDRSESPGLSLLSNDIANYAPRSMRSTPNSIHSEARSTRSANTDEQDDTESYQSSHRRPVTAGQASLASHNTDGSPDRPRRKGITFLGRKILGS